MDTLQSFSNDIVALLQQADSSFWLFFIGMWVVCGLVQVAGNKWLGKDWMQRLTGEDCNCNNRHGC